MRHVRMLGLCLAAMFAVAAVTATAASASSPEWGQCYAKAGGKYADSNCQTKAKKGTGAYEWRKDAEVAHKGFSGGSVETSHPLLTTFVEFCRRGNQYINPSCEPPGEEGTEAEATVECASETNVGEVTGKDEIKNVIAHFRGCKLFGDDPCTNTPNEEEIVTNTLKGKLGYLNKNATPREVGVLLEPLAKNGQFAQFSCEVGRLQISVGTAPGTKDEKGYYSVKGGGDGIISTITPINTMTSDLTQVFTAGTGEEGGAENIPNKLEGGKLKTLESITTNVNEPEYRSSWSRASETLTNVNVGAEEAEIKA
jgi:hypothetical protein